MSQQSKTIDERRDILDQTIADILRRGYRLESRTEYSAVVVSGRPVNHILHLIITLCTVFLWSIVWLMKARFGGEKRLLIQVDEQGRISTSRLKR